MPVDTPRTGHPEAGDDLTSAERTACCVVGGGPAGMVLALLLARRGIAVTLLEAHKDFNREFRGDTLHPAILEILDQVGLAEKVHRLPHTKWYGPVILAADGPFMPVDLRSLKSKFPYIMLLPQEHLLPLLAREAQAYPNFRLVLGAAVQKLVVEGDVVRGVRYRSADGWHEVRATLTAGADGRFSRLRHLAGLMPVVLGPPVELLWFQLPRLPGDGEDLDAFPAAVRANPLAVIAGERDTAAGFVRRGGGRLMVVFNRVDHWQVGYFHLPGRYAEIRAAGIATLRAAVAELEPRLAPHLAALDDWHQVAPLSVAFSRCRRWYRPGLLLIGDAAHVMTPAAGAGIKYAIEDAVVAANRLAGPLRSGRVTTGQLAAVQRRREWPVRFIQAAGGWAQKSLLPLALRPSSGAKARARVPWLVRFLVRLPLLRSLPARMVGNGIWPVRVESGDGQKLP